MTGARQTTDLIAAGLLAITSWLSTTPSYSGIPVASDTFAPDVLKINPRDADGGERLRDRQEALFAACGINPSDADAWRDLSLALQRVFLTAFQMRERHPPDGVNRSRPNTGVDNEFMHLTSAYREGSRAVEDGRRKSGRPVTRGDYQMSVATAERKALNQMYRDGLVVFEMDWPEHDPDSLSQDEWEALFDIAFESRLATLSRISARKRAAIANPARGVPLRRRTVTLDQEGKYVAYEPGSFGVEGPEYFVPDLVGQDFRAFEALLRAAANSTSERWRQPPAISGEVSPDTPGII